MVHLLFVHLYHELDVLRGLELGRPHLARLIGLGVVDLLPSAERSATWRNNGDEWSQLANHAKRFVALVPQR